MEIEIKQTCFGPDWQSWCGGSGWTTTATMWLLSATNNEWAFFNAEAYGSTSQKIVLDHGFSFHTPQKTMIIFFEFHPIKTALRPQGTAAILRVRFPFQDLWWPVWRSSHQMQHGAITLAPQKKEMIIILLICLRYDERRKAELWLRCCRSCFFPGTDSHNELSAGLWSLTPIFLNGGIPPP